MPRLRGTRGASLRAPAASAAAGGTTITAPTAYWDLDEAVALDTTRVDTVTSPAACNLVASASFTTGKIGTCATFTGSNYLRDVSAPAKMNPSTGAWTLAGWFYGTGNGTGFSVGNTFAASGLELFLSTTTLVIRANNATDSYSATRTFSLNAWHFVVARFDGTNISLSVDDGAVASAASGVFTYFNRFYVGNRQDSGSNGWQGRIDEVAWIVGTAISAAEITALYNGGAGKTYNGSAWV